MNNEFDYYRHVFSWFRKNASDQWFDKEHYELNKLTLIDGIEVGYNEFSFDCKSEDGSMCTVSAQRTPIEDWDGEYKINSITITKN